MYIFIKRALDIVICAVGIVFLAWLLILIPILIKLDSKGAVMFCQKRVGINKKHFMIYKYRTMKTDTPKDTPTHLLKDPDQFITKMGKFLRRTSLDELPQLFNILKGDMSIVGPRPALWNQFDLIDLRGKANGVRPGLTGLAQISGRDELPISEKAQLDIAYVNNMGFIYDCKIFFKTVIIAIKGRGFSEGGGK